ncbi:MAG: glycosyltransferase [Trichodesmium sp.]
MKILLLHNRYQIPGGEDAVVESEKSLLTAKGHSVDLLETNNDQISGLMASAKTAINAIYSNSSKQLVSAKISSFQPDIVHVHNFFPQFSPAVYDACQDAGVPVVQTLHNYRLLCPNAYFFRDGEVCEDCLGKFVPWPGIIHRCYRDSYLGSAVVATMLTVNKLRQTWTEKVDYYIALTEFAKQKFIQGGLPSEKMVVKPNFVYPDPGIGEGIGDYALFVGRLSSEKGLNTMLDAWQILAGKIPLKIIGDGLIANTVQEFLQKLTNVEWLGRKLKPEVYALIGNAKFLVFPSKWYETFGLVAIEAFARGTPVIASNLGSLSSLIKSGHTGFHFRPGDPNDLAAQVEYALTHPEKLRKMRLKARAEFEAKYTAEQNYHKLMDIYNLAIASQNLS